MGKNCNKALFWGGKTSLGYSPLQELEEGRHSGLYLLVKYKESKKIYITQSPVFS